MSDQKGYSFSIYDANPAFDIKPEYSDIIFAYSEEQALEMAQSNLEDAAFGRSQDLGYEIGDKIYLTLSDSSGTLIATLSHDLTAEDLGIIEEIDPTQFVTDGFSAIGNYSELCGEQDGDEPVESYVYLTASKSNRYYSFVAKDSNGERSEYGSVYYSRDAAEKAARQFIRELTKKEMPIGLSLTQTQT